MSCVLKITIDGVLSIFRNLLPNNSLPAECFSTCSLFSAKNSAIKGGEELIVVQLLLPFAVTVMLVIQQHSVIFTYIITSSL